MSGAQQGEILALILVAVVAGCAIIGLCRGLVYGIYSVVKNILVVLAAIGAAPVVARLLPETMPAKEGVGYVITFLISIIVFNIIGSFIKAIRDMPLLKGLDRVGGTVAGVIVGFFMAWSLLAVLGCFQEYEWCQELVQASREQPVVMWFQSCSPLPALLERFEFPFI